MSKYKNIVFLQPTKTGSSSVLVGLEKYNIRKNHEPITCGNIERLKYKDTYSFTTIRNPYDRALSMYNFFGMFEGKCFDYFLEYIKTNKENRLFAEQYRYYKFGTFKVNSIIRLESFDEDWSDVLNKELKLTSEPIHVNEDVRKSKTKLSVEEKSFIYNLYKEDFQTFGYKK